MLLDRTRDAACECESTCVVGAIRRPRTVRSAFLDGQRRLYAEVEVRARHTTCVCNIAGDTIQCCSMRVVFDTDVMVAAMRSAAGASRRLLEDALGRRFTILISVPLIFEYEAVMKRTEHLKAAELSEEDVDVILDGLVAIAAPVRLAFLWRPALPDPDDDMVLESAVNGGADLLVTFNARHFRNAAASFQVSVVSPGDALKRLESRHENK